MVAMILAAGLGERMRPLTDITPKPLLEVHAKPLIIWHIERLAKAGFKTIVINIAHLGYQIPQAVGNGSRWGVEIIYSDEQEIGALESAGGIIKALPLLGERFLVLNADIFCDYTFNPHFELEEDVLAHLILVNNPPHNPHGDFGLKESVVVNEDRVQYTFSGIGYYSAKLFRGKAVQKLALAPLLREQIEHSAVTAELYSGVWHDIGTPKRLREINRS